MIAHEQTGIPMDKIDVVWGDTDLVPVGGGTMGSRSLQQGGAPCPRGRRARRQGHASSPPGCSRPTRPTSCSTRTRGAFHVAGTPAVAKTWAELAVAAKDDPDLPEGLAHAAYYAVSGATFPFGAHVAVVEVDTETGQVKHLRHVACDDAGRVLNPMLLEGQIHGGVAQGAAQALLEEVRYDERRQPDHVEPRRLRVHLGRRAAELRGRPHGDADVHQPARRQGHRRVRHDRLAPRRCSPP